MIVWLLMALDLIVVISVSVSHFGGEISYLLLLVCGGYLIGKYFFFKDNMSAIDGIFGVYIIILALFHVSWFIYYLFLGWFMYKLITLVTM